MLHLEHVGDALVAWPRVFSKLSPLGRTVGLEF